MKHFSLSFLIFASIALTSYSKDFEIIEYSHLYIHTCHPGILPTHYISTFSHDQIGETIDLFLVSGHNPFAIFKPMESRKARESEKINFPFVIESQGIIEFFFTCEVEEKIEFSVFSIAKAPGQEPKKSPNSNEEYHKIKELQHIEYRPQRFNYIDQMIRILCYIFLSMAILSLLYFCIRAVIQIQAYDSEDMDSINDLECNQNKEDTEKVEIKIHDELNKVKAIIENTNSNDSTIADENLCAVCYEREKEIVYKPCNHECCCLKCTEIILTTNPQCPLCRGPLLGFEVKNAPVA